MLELYLSNPHSAEMRRIMKHKIDIQISGGYKFNPQSQFLLVINSFTAGEVVTQIQSFIRTQLFLGVDVLNLSLTGSILDSTTNNSALHNYKGKSIIVTGNPFTYFSKSKRYNWHLINPQDVFALSMSNTSFLFCGLLNSEDLKFLKKWVPFLIYPIDVGYNANVDSKVYQSRRELVKSIHVHFFLEDPNFGLRHQFTLSRRFRIFHDLTWEKLYKAGRTLSKILGKSAPTRRYLIMSYESDTRESESSTGIISGGTSPQECKLYHFERATCLFSSYDYISPNDHDCC